MTRRCACGNLTRVRDYDEMAVCTDCQDENDRDEAQVRAESDQAGAQFIGRERETRGAFG